MRPTLPQSDSRADERTTQLAESRETYRWNYEWPPNVARADEVPRKDSYSPSYVAHLLPISWDLFKNTLELGIVASPLALSKLLAGEMLRVPKLQPDEIGQWFHQLPVTIAQHIAAEDPVSVDSFDKFFQAIEAPPVVGVWDTDRAFCWQRIAGANPMMLSRITELPGNIAITEEHWKKAIGSDSLAAALAEGRAFAVDYSALEDVQAGTTFERGKCLRGPYALFASVGRELKAVAIQIGQSPDSPVYTPADGEGWTIAKLACQVADANFHETFFHLARTHMVMEAVTISARRRLAERHPLYLLLMEHTEYTMPINHSAATNLIAPDGVIDHCFGATIEGSADLIRVALDGHDLMKAAPAVDIAARGLDDVDVLPEHPYRDDALLVYQAIHRYIDGYIRLYYPADDVVVGDTELQGFVTELAAEDGGRIRGVPERLTDVDTLVTLIANIVWTGTGQHSAVNFPQFPYMCLPPNMAGAMWKDWPDGPNDETKHLDVLPPYNLALMQFNTVYQLSNLRVSYLGKYPRSFFKDDAVRPVVDALQAELETVEGIINEREPKRFLPYPFLLPSTIPGSIHI